MNAYLEAVLQGAGLGLMLGFSFGPSFFALLKTSMSKGFRSGLALAVGIIISDLLCVALALYGAAAILDTPRNKMIVGIVGGTILAVYGFYSFFQKKKMNADEEGNIYIPTVNFPVTMIKGFLLNILNPFVFLLWFGWVAGISGKAHFTTAHILIFFSVSLAVIFATDVLKVVIAYKIKPLLTPRFFNIVNKILGLVMVILGIVMVYRTTLSIISATPS